MTDEIVVGGHRRIRPFNTADTYPEQNLGNDLCQAVVAGNTVYVRGQVAQDLDTRENVAVGDAAGQTQKVCDNILLLLSEAGAQPEHIVSCHIYLTDIRYREDVYRVMGERLAGVYYVSTGLVVQALARPEWLVEVGVVAVIP
ncbi:RidA family protein [Branchiibius cervicis]|uniref:RidA family protein n=1 Tax=Branchiibius cervicis TaxID=908252 RepID=A0ABW2AXA3_9MICO